METIGVEAVVEGLTSFLGDLKKMGSGLDDLRPKATLLQQAFGWVTDSLGGLGRELLNIAEYAMGKLLADAIQWTIQQIGELITATIEAGQEFQVLELRLRRLNFNDLVESGMEYNEATRQSIELTQDQLTWLQKLAAQTPYDNADISNVYTMARGYGFSATEAQGLTETIANFAAGMGLGNEEIERIIVNFGQMVQQGKVTQRELTDLARGAFVPVNDILKIMQERTGLAGKEFEDFRTSTEGVNMFMEAFTELVETRFNNAAQAMAQTFKGASDNALDLVKSIGGLQVVKPVLDTIGKGLSDFINLFTTGSPELQKFNEEAKNFGSAFYIPDPNRWDLLTAAAGRLGKALSDIVAGVFDLLPSTESLADGVVAGVENLATWVEDNQENIIGFFKDVGTTIQEDIVPFLVNDLIPAIGDFVGWIVDNKEEILDLFKRLGEFLLNDVLPVLKDDVIPAIGEFITWILDNKDTIIEWVEKLAPAFIKWQIIATIISIVLGLFISFITWLISVIGVVLTVIGVLSVLGGIVGTVVAVVLLVISGLALFIGLLVGIYAWVTLVVISIQTLLDNLDAFKEILTNALGEAWEAIKNGDWAGAGEAIIQGIIDGMNYMKTMLITNILLAATEMWQAFKDFLGIASPSTLFAEAGENIIQGVIDGIIAKATELKDSLVLTATQAWEALKEFLGIASPSTLFKQIGIDIINGIIEGVKEMGSTLIDTLVKLALDAWNAMKDALGIKSPSTLFMEVGEFSILGFAKGIEQYTGLATRAMQVAVAKIAIPAMTLSPMLNAAAGSRNVNNNQSTAFNLSVNRVNDYEPIVQDFNMMQSMVGA